MYTRLLGPAKGSYFLFGPRGTGKTTRIREHVKPAAAYDLLETAESLRLNREPAAFGKECDGLDRGSWVVVACCPSPSSGNGPGPSCGPTPRLISTRRSRRKPWSARSAPLRGFSKSQRG